ncbi:hypothetical protein [Noviherbaspirillum aridicola]|uniref:Uncharacterized protein n=1 Tax=Noviherbaspirillum aridicola TaxID=2849687 RepID=A0ABQ4Q4M6_9BURK|nr:hypothetical protein [Noviherbaspirillum aridicola]GIZ52124.1 hypothetical protein NCCP691_21380 [Noviherbaspirillum aridicola]
MAINTDLKAIWNVWKDLHSNSTDPNVKQLALANLQAMDIIDDGQKNNSVDSSMKIWDIQDPGQGTNNTPGGSNGSPDTNTTFKNLWSQLPKDVQEAVKKKFAGDDGEFTDAEKTKAIEYMHTHAWNDAIVSPGDIERLRKDLGLKIPDQAEVNKNFDQIMSQVPAPLKNKLTTNFAGPDGTFSDEEKGRVVEFVNSKGGTDGLSQGEIETVFNEVDSYSRNLEQINGWLVQLPQDLKVKLTEKLAGPDMNWSQEEVNAAHEYFKSKTSGGNFLTPADVDALRKDMGLEKSQLSTQDVNTYFTSWMSGLPEDVKKKLTEKFAGEDGQFDDEEKRKAVEYLGPINNWLPTFTQLGPLKSELGMNAKVNLESEETVNTTFEVWWRFLPPDAQRKLTEKYAGPDKQFDTAEKKRMLEYIDSVGDLHTLDPRTVEAIREDQGIKGSGLTKDEVDKLFKQWMDQLPEDVRNKLKQKFGGLDGELSDAEKSEVVEFIAVLAGWDDKILATELPGIQLLLGLGGAGGTGGTGTGGSGGTGTGGSGGTGTGGTA